MVAVDRTDSGSSESFTDQELVSFYSEQTGESEDESHHPSSQHNSRYSGYSGVSTTAPPTHNGPTRMSLQTPQNSGAIIASNNAGQNGISIFQRYMVLNFKRMNKAIVLNRKSTSCLFPYLFP